MKNRESDAGRSTESSVVWPKPGQLGTSSAGNKLEWACSKCTFLNPLSKSHCGACGAVNPSHKSKWAIGYKSYGKISNKITKQNNSMKRSGANKKVTRRDPRANSGAVGNATITVYVNDGAGGSTYTSFNMNVTGAAQCECECAGIIDFYGICIGCWNWPPWECQRNKPLKHWALKLTTTSVAVLFSATLRSGAQPSLA